MKSVRLGNFIEEHCEKNKKGEDIPVFSVTNTNGFCTEYFSKDVSSKDKSNYKIVHKGFFAYNPSRINVGSVDWLRNEEKVIVSPLYNVFSVSPELEKQYLYYFLKSERGKTLIKSKAEGSVRDNLKFSILADFPIPLPSIEEQRKFVAKLDKSNELIFKYKRLLEYYDTLIKSRFIEMFGDPIENTKSWIEEPLGNCCLLKAGKAIKASELADKDKEHPYPCFGGNGIRGFISKKSHTGKIVLIGRQGALCGNVQLTDGDFYATEHAVVTSPKKELNSIWLYHLLFLMDLNRYKSGAAQPGLTVEKLNTVPTMIVPIELQNDFAAFVQQIDKSKFEYTNIGVAA